MKSKKLLVVLILLILLVAGWLMAVRAASGKETIEKQNALTQEADGYMEKQLYVRAIPTYEEALGLKTDRNAEIEAKLLEAYLGYEDYGAYADLAEQRMEDNTASVEEYLTVADYYINRRKIEEAMEIVLIGIAQTGSEELEEYYEANRYQYNLRVTKYQDILPTRDNTLMPAYDGEKWCYVDSKGRIQWETYYDRALPFNTVGYAVVSMDGTWYTINSIGDRYGVDENPAEDVYAVTSRHILAKVNGAYSYYNYDFQCVAQSHQYEEITANACGVAAVKKNGKWGIITDSGSVVVDFTLDDVAVNSLGAVFADNVAMVKTGELWYLIDTEGNKISEQGFADAKAPESAGYIAVADSSGLWGFIDHTGAERISCQYDDAKSFSNGVAAVKKIDYWGYISAFNVMVINNDFVDAQPFHNGIAQAEMYEGEALITLSYFVE